MLKKVSKMKNYNRPEEIQKRSMIMEDMEGENKEYKVDELLKKGIMTLDEYIMFEEDLEKGTMTFDDFMRYKKDTKEEGNNVEKEDMIDVEDIN